MDFYVVLCIFIILVNGDVVCDTHGTLKNELAQTTIFYKFGQEDVSWSLYSVKPSTPSRIPTLEGNGQVSWEVTEAFCETGERSSQIFGVFVVGTISDASNTLLLTRYWQMFPSSSAVRVWGNLTNIGAASFQIRQAQLLALEWGSNECSNGSGTGSDATSGSDGTATFFEIFHVEQWSYYRAQRFVAQASRVSSFRVPMRLQFGSYPSSIPNPINAAWFALGDGGSGSAGGGTGTRSGSSSDSVEGVAVGIEFNGKSSLQAYFDVIGHVRVDIDDLNHTLAPGESFEWPGFFAVLYSGDWDEAGYQSQRFHEAALSPPLPDANYPYVQFDSWSYGLDINETNQMAALNVSIELGLEAFVLDLGWATRIGEWVPDPVKFPRGLKPLVDRAHAANIKFGLHLPLAQANLEAPVLLQHPEWAAFHDDDYFNATGLCLGHQPALDWLVNAVIDLLESTGADYLVEDGEDMVKRCEHSDHTHAFGDTNYVNSVQGLDVFWAKIRAYKPDLVLEFCADGGTMLTFKTVRLFDTAISVDNSPSYTSRMGVFGQSYYFSPRYSARYLQDFPISKYVVRSHMFGGPLILQQDFRLWNQSQITLAKSLIDDYKRYRPFIRDCKVIHLLAPQGSIDQPYGWDAIQGVDAKQLSSLVFVFREMSSNSLITLPLRGLARQRTYECNYVDRGIGVNVTGGQLMDRGLDLTLAVQGSEIIEIKALA